MSKPLFQDLTSTTVRRNRQSYIVLSLILFAALVADIFTGAFFYTLLEPIPVLAYIAAAISGALGIAITVVAWTVSAQRVRDIGHSGWWVFIQLLPYVGWVFSLAITFVPGDTHQDNEYGPSLVPQKDV